MQLPQLVRAPLNRPEIWTTLGWSDVIQSYRRSFLGPIWITLSTVIFCAVLVLVYGGIFNVDTRSYIGYIVCGMINWVWISTLITEGGNTFKVHASFLKGTPLEKSLLIWAMAYKHLVILGHNLIVYLALLVFGVVPLNSNVLYALPAIVIVFLMSVPILAITSILFVRFHDLQKLATSLLVVLMFLTPVFWKPEMIGGWRIYLIHYNPFYYQIEIVRASLLGEPPQLLVWGVSLALLFVLWATGLAFYTRYQRYVAFWI